MVTSTSHSPEATEQLGETWGRSAKPGWVIGLSGELGAGKTRLVKGLARGLGATDRVHSPTYALLNEYPSGLMPLIHIDLYRLDTPEAVSRAGLLDYILEPPGVTVVEWIEHWLPDLAARMRGSSGNSDGLAQTPLDWLKTGRRLRWVWIESPSESIRRIGYEDFGG